MLKWRNNTFAIHIIFTCFFTLGGEVEYMYTPLKLGRGNFGSNYWSVYSHRLGRAVNLYNDLEYDHWVLIESNYHIEKYCEKPKEIIGYIKGKKVKSCFDMWIKDGTMETFVRIRYKGKETAKELLLKDWSVKNGINYILKNEDDIRFNMILLDNLKLILSFTRNRSYLVDIDIFKILKLVKKDTVTISQIILTFPEIPPSRVYESISRMIFDGIIQCNIDSEIFGPNLDVAVHAPWR